MRGFHIVSWVALFILMITMAACGNAVTQVVPTERSAYEQVPTDEPHQEIETAPEATINFEYDLEDFQADNFDHPTAIDNEFFPLQPGMQFVFDGYTQEGEIRIPHSILFTVTDLTKEIAGVQTVVVWILDYSDDQLVEAEIAFYAQDNDGNVWFMGEYPEVYENGILVEAPAWIPGIKGAKAGIVMKSEPQMGMPSYSQGWGPAVNWTDRGRVVQMSEETCVPVGCYDNVLVTEEFSQTEPDAYQLKYYAPGVGNVKVGWRGEDASKETLDLVEITLLDLDALAEVRVAALALEQQAYEFSKEVYDQTKPSEYDLTIE